MAGHSKWANIQHRKGAQDKKRGRLFSKFIKEITVAARMGGSDMNANPRLRLAVDKALSGNMTRDTVERAIKKGSGELDGENYEEVRYEGYGPGGVAIIVDCLTDNINRTVSEVRHAFTKHGGNLGTNGSVAYMFTKAGVLSFPVGTDEDSLMDVALEAGADDVATNDDGSIDVLTPPNDFPEIRQAIIDAGFKPEMAEVTMRPETTIALDLDGAQKMLRLTDVMEDLDDVQDVYSNADIPDDVLAQME